MPYCITIVTKSPRVHLSSHFLGLRPNVSTQGQICSVLQTFHSESAGAKLTDAETWQASVLRKKGTQARGNNHWVLGILFANFCTSLIKSSQLDGPDLTWHSYSRDTGETQRLRTKVRQLENDQWWFKPRFSHQKFTSPPFQVRRFSFSSSLCVSSTWCLSWRHPSLVSVLDFTGTFLMLD